LAVIDQNSREKSRRCGFQYEKTAVFSSKNIPFQKSPIGRCAVILFFLSWRADWPFYLGWRAAGLYSFEQARRRPLFF
jgi:hypothetical protein